LLNAFGLLLRNLEKNENQCKQEANHDYFEKAKTKTKSKLYIHMRLFFPPLFFRFCFFFVFSFAGDLMTTTFENV
jgi:hypothetical protein